MTAVRGPPSCPDCGHDPTGDEDEFKSGGGWVFDNEAAAGKYVEILRCPVCDSEVARNEKQMNSGGRR